MFATVRSKYIECRWKNLHLFKWILYYKDINFVTYLLSRLCFHYIMDDGDALFPRIHQANQHTNIAANDIGHHQEQNCFSSVANLWN